MGKHTAARGYSTAQSNGMTGSPGQYSGKHREDDGITGQKLGKRDAQVSNVYKMSDYDPTKRVSE